MLTYTLKKAPGVPLYEALYRGHPAGHYRGVACPPGRNCLPARWLRNLKVSKITVEAARSPEPGGATSALSQAGVFSWSRRNCAAPGPGSRKNSCRSARPAADLTGSAPGFPLPCGAGWAASDAGRGHRPFEAPAPIGAHRSCAGPFRTTFFRFRGFRATGKYPGGGRYGLPVYAPGPDSGPGQGAISWRNRAAGKIRSIYPSRRGQVYGRAAGRFRGQSGEASWGPTCCTFPPLPSFPPRASSPCPGGELLQWSENSGNIIS